MPKSAQYLAFEDPRIILVRDGDTGHCASFWDEESIGLFQAHDGPTHLVVGRRASEDQLRRAASRFGIDMEVVRAFRDGDGHQQVVARLVRKEASHG